MVLTAEEKEIVFFYREGLTIPQLVLATGYSAYILKKLLAYEPEFARLGYIFRNL